MIYNFIKIYNLILKILGKISGLPGKYKFHCRDIPEPWFKVDVITVLQSGVALMRILKAPSNIVRGPVQYRSRST